MIEITPALREKFLRFHEAYEFARAKLKDEGASGAVIAVKVWKAAEREVPLTPDELHLYKRHIALQSVNGGILFAIEDEDNW
jgi:hypothetical protein